MKKNQGKIEKLAQIRLEKVDKKLSNLISRKNRDKVNKIFKSISNSDNSCNTMGMWKQVKKLFPKMLRTVPSGITNHKGTIVTKPFSVKQIIMRKYLIRLRQRPYNLEVRYLMEIKEENARRIMEIASEVKTRPWTTEDLLKC